MDDQKLNCYFCYFQRFCSDNLESVCPMWKY